MNHFKPLTVLTLVLIFWAACSYMTKFEKQELDFSVFQDAPPEVQTPCKDDCGCTLYGPCYKCIDNLCKLADNADQDNDKYLSMECPVNDTCARERNLPEQFWPKKGDDCNDLDPDINPGEVDRCNAKDDDCDGLKDEDTSTFGPSGPPKKIASGYRVRYCIYQQNTLLIWDNKPAGQRVQSGFLDMEGNLFNPAVLTEEGWGVDMACVPGSGAVSVWSDKRYGNTDIILQKLDALGAPQAGQDPIHFPEDSLQSLEAAVSYHEGLSMAGVAWLTHDTDVLAKAELRVMDFYTLDMVYEWRWEGESFMVPGSPPTYTYEKTNLSAFSYPCSFSDCMETSVVDGFAMVWNTTSGIYFAPYSCSRSEPMSCGKQVEPFLVGVSGDVRFPDLEWAGDRFILSYVLASQDPLNPSGMTTAPMFAQIVPVGINGWETRALDIDPVIDFGMQSTYPVTEWTPGLGEVVFAWGDGAQFGERRIRFVRMMLSHNDSTGRDYLAMVIDRIIDVSLAESFAGAPDIEYRSTIGAEGFIVTWTERNPSGGSDVYMRTIRCRQEE